MKKNIHPNYVAEMQVICACGNKITTGSTVAEIRTDLCSACHPFFTGKQKLVDTARRVEKFGAKLQATKEIAGTKKGKTVKRTEKAEKTKAKKNDKK